MTRTFKITLSCILIALAIILCSLMLHHYESRMDAQASAYSGQTSEEITVIPEQQYTPGAVLLGNFL